MGDNSFFDPLELSRSYTASPVPGLSSGRPSIDMALSMLLNSALTPRPLSGTNQGVYDAYRMRSRNLDFMAARNHAFANNLFAQQLGGIDPNSTVFRMISPFISDPDGPVMNMLSPLMGGNPVKAQMGLYAGLTGQTMGAFGQNRNISLDETDALMKSAYSGLFHTDRIDDNFIQRYKNNSLNGVTSRFGKGSAQEDAYRRAIGSKNSSEGLAQLERQYGSVDNSKLTSLIERTMDAVKETTKKSDITGAQKDSEISKIKDDARKAANEFIDKVTDPQARLKLSQAFSKAIEESQYGAKGFAKDFSAVNSDLIAKLRGTMSYEDKKGQNIARSVNFEKTRGFQVEDITSGFAAAANYRLVGKGSVAQEYENFQKNAPAAMDAAREVFGNNRTGEQLVGDIQQLIGNSQLNMGNSKDAEVLENLLREIKATARTQGIGTQEILQIINQGKQMASMHPGLNNLGGFEITKMANNAMLSTGTMTSYLSNQYIRREGGPVTIAQQLMAGQIESAGQPISQMTGAMYEYFASRGNKKATQDIQNYVDGKTKFTRDAGGFTAFVSKLSTDHGEDVFKLQDFAANNARASSLGLDRNPSIATLGGAAMRDVFKQYLMTGDNGAENMAALELVMGGGNRSGKDLIKKYKLNEHGTKTINSLSDRLKNGESLGLDDLVAALQLKDPYGIVNEMVQGRYEEGFRYDYDKNYKAQKDRDLLFRQESANISKKMSAKLAHLHAPIIQGIVAQLMNGSVEEGGIKELLSPLKDGSPEYRAMEAELKKIDNLTKSKSVDSLVDVYGGSKDKMSNLLTVSKNMSYSDIRRYAGKSGLFEGDLDELTKSGRDPDRLAQMKKLNYSMIQKAAETLKFIDPKDKLNGKEDIFGYASKATLEKALGIYNKQQEDDYGKNASDRFREVLRGEGLQGLDESNKDLLQKDFATIRDKLKSVGAYDDKTGLNAKRYEELRAAKPSSKEGKVFRDIENDLVGRVDDSGKEVSKGLISKSSKSYFDSVIGMHQEGMTEINTQNEALLSSIKSSEGLSKVTDAMSQLNEKLGPGFGTSIIKAIADLAARLEQATR